MGRYALWQCSVCGYIYDPAKGDVEAGVKPGTPFEAIPVDWACPDCGAGAVEFAAYHS